jgi:hypothetical protein
VKRLAAGPQRPAESPTPRERQKFHPVFGFMRATRAAVKPPAVLSASSASSV